MDLETLSKEVKQKTKDYPKPKDRDVPEDLLKLVVGSGVSEGILQCLTYLPVSDAVDLIALSLKENDPGTWLLAFLRERIKEERERRGQSKRSDPGEDDLMGGKYVPPLPRSPERGII